VIADSLQLVSEASFSDCVPPDPFTTIILRVALLIELPASDLKSNFMYPTITGEPSETRVVALPEFVKGESARTVASATGISETVPPTVEGGGGALGVGVRVGVGAIGDVVGVGVGVGEAAVRETASIQTSPTAPATLKCSETSEFDAVAEYEKLKVCHAVVSENRFSVYTLYGDTVCWRAASSVRAAPAFAANATVYF
jgi:hypothetical protein